MESRIITLKCSELREGMVIAKDVEKNGRILVKKNMKVTLSIIKKMQDVLLIESIQVYDPLGRTISLKEKEIENLNKIENDFNEISDKLKDAFEYIEKDIEYIKEIRSLTDKIFNKIDYNNIVIKNIVLHGSKEDSIYRHGVNVAALSLILGKWIGLSDISLKQLMYSALLHDIGKTKIDKNILEKKSNLTTSEYKCIKSHSVLGYRMVKSIPYMDKNISYGVLMHHEREDGSGYPLGLKGNQIHQFGKIIAIADVFDAINSDRGYKRKKAPFEALQIVKNESLGRLNYEYVKIFLEHIINYYLGEQVILNNGDKCKIIQMNINDLERPLLLKDDNFIDLSKCKELSIKELLL